MRFLRPAVIPALLFFFASCSSLKKATESPVPVKKPVSAAPTGKAKTFTKPVKINRDEFVAYAKTLLGTPYKYGSANPAGGLDCSGFITYVFGHFNVKTPRTSVDFTNEGQTIQPEEARPGDIVLFTGSDNSTGIVGHMGIIISNKSTMQFIHSASGKNIGVIINNLTGYYLTHFVKVIRILE